MLAGPEDESPLEDLKNYHYRKLAVKNLHLSSAGLRFECRYHCCWIHQDSKTAVLVWCCLSHFSILYPTPSSSYSCPHHSNQTAISKRTKQVHIIFSCLYQAFLKYLDHTVTHTTPCLTHLTRSTLWSMKYTLYWNSIITGYLIKSKSSKDMLSTLNKQE